MTLVILTSASAQAATTYRTAHFTFTLYDGLTTDFAIPLGQALEDNYRRVLDDLAVTSSPQVPVRIYGSRDHFFDVMQDVTGARVFFDGFAWKGQIYLDATSAANLSVLIVHEFAHIATNLLRPRGLEARWLHEAIAQYEAGSFFHPAVLSYLRDGQAPPSLTQLDAGANTTREIYTLGYVLTEFILQTWGRPRLIDLIKANGSIPSGLGLTVSAFESQFATYLREAYFVRPEEQFLTNTAEVIARSVLKPMADPASWTFQLTASGQGTMAIEDDALVFRTTAITGTPWHVQAYQTGIAFEEGASYLVRFRVKSPDQATFRVIATINQPRYGTIGLDEPISAGPEFTEHSVMFKAAHVVPGDNRFGFVLGYGLGTVIVKDLAVARMQPPPPLPVITRPPATMHTRAGGDAFFSAGVNGQYVTFQWRRDGVDLPGATASTLLLDNVDAEDAGAYSLRVTNGSGAVESAAGNLIVTASGSARLVNLSVRAQVGTGGNILIAGFVLSGSGAPAQLLLRAVGPRLAAFQVSDLLPDPALAVVPSGASTAVALNDNWQNFTGLVAMEAAREQVGAFSLLDSKPEASLLVTLPSGGYTVPTADAGSGTGVALSEIYVVTTSADPDAAQLINLSARAQVGLGDNVLIPGFVITGDTAMTLLIRAVGPGLERFDVGGVLADPRFTVYRSLPGGGSEAIGGNDNWEDSPSLPLLTQATLATHAFPLASGSADAALLLALNPGAYTVVVTGAESATGVALVELYRVALD